MESILKLKLSDLKKFFFFALNSLKKCTAPLTLRLTTKEQPIINSTGCFLIDIENESLEKFIVR